MPNLDDPRLNLVRPQFIATVQRLSLLFALANFVSVLPLYFLSLKAPQSSVFMHYIMSVTVAGVVFLGMALLCRYLTKTDLLSHLFFTILFFQICYLLHEIRQLNHPVTLCLPFLSLLAPFVLGPKRSYLISALGSLAFLTLYLFPGKGTEPKSLPLLLLLVGISFFVAHIAEELWNAIQIREQKWRNAYKNAEDNAAKMKIWIEQLGQASQLAQTGQVSPRVGTATKVFTELTRDLDDAQTTLGHYFGNLLMGDRLRSVGLLATGIAHELNTPLTTLEFILERDTGLKPESKQVIKEELDRMGQIIKGLLAFTHPGSEGAATFDLNETVRKNHRYFELVRKKVSIHIDLHPSPISIRGFQQEIQQVILNLVENSIHAVEGASKPSVWIITQATGTLMVKDNGCGIESHLLPRVLEPFFTTKPPGQGVGLGLFIVNGIVQKHGGQIEIRSQKNQGTQITVRFPVVEELALREAA